MVAAHFSPALLPMARDAAQNQRKRRALPPAPTDRALPPARGRLASMPSDR
jgi:hypothetical protein